MCLKLLTHFKIVRPTLCHLQYCSLALIQYEGDRSLKEESLRKLAKQTLYYSILNVICPSDD